VVLEERHASATWIDHAERLGDDAAVLAFVLKAARGGPTLVAIDAPLIVPNEDGARPVDRDITSLFGRYQAGCYPANRNRPGGCTRGEDIVRALSAHGFVQQPYMQRRAAVRNVIEVYPHPAMISLFQLHRTLKYKARANRSLSTRRSELLRLRDYLINLRDREPGMIVPSTIQGREISALKGVAFKHYEDLLDAAICAYIAYYVWYWGPEGYEIYGDTARGYIVVPMTDWMRCRLVLDQSPKTR
jgi:predicted RNase H-like nuclease